MQLVLPGPKLSSTGRIRLKNSRWQYNQAWVCRQAGEAALSNVFHLGGKILNTRIKIEQWGAGAVSSSHRRSWCHSVSAVCRALSVRKKGRSQALCVPVLALLWSQREADSPGKRLWARWGSMKERFLEGDLVGSKKKRNADTQTSKCHVRVGESGHRRPQSAWHH